MRPKGASNTVDLSFCSVRPSATGRSAMAEKYSVAQAGAIRTGEIIKQAASTKAAATGGIRCIGMVPGIARSSRTSLF